MLLLHRYYYVTTYVIHTYLDFLKRTEEKPEHCIVLIQMNSEGIENTNTLVPSLPLKGHIEFIGTTIHHFYPKSTSRDFSDGTIHIKRRDVLGGGGVKNLPNLPTENCRR